MSSSSETRMSYEDALDVIRDAINIGDEREFYCTLEGESGEGFKPRKYTGQTVTVIAYADEPEPGAEPGFKVRASDGVEFFACKGELDGFYRDTGQYYQADFEPKWTP